MIARIISYNPGLSIDNLADNRKIKYQISEEPAKLPLPSIRKVEW